MSCLLFILWLIAGAGVLSSGDISKTEYMLCWGCLMLNLLVDIFGSER